MLQQHVYLAVQTLKKTPHLHIIQIGDDFASSSYISRKQDMGKQLGIEVTHHHFNLNENADTIKQVMVDIIAQKDGVIVQLPVPTQFQPIIHSVPWFCDVDLLGLEANKSWDNGIVPPTIAAIDMVLKDILNLHINNTLDTSMLNLQGKNVAVIGQGVLVGNPLLRYLRDREATILSINKNTQNPQSITKLADIVITGAGVPGLIDKNWLKDDAIVIDAATSESNNKLVGDIDYKNLPEHVTVCPSPGGVGPLTVLSLFYNLILLGK